MTDCRGTDIKVAVIGGGVAGLVCAARLKQLGLQTVTVFDTGRHAVGGRCSSRIENVKGQIVTFDHSVQYFTVTNARFERVVNFLVRDGAAKVWSGKIGHLSNGKFLPEAHKKKAFIGTGGMRSIAESLAKHCNIQRPGWVSSIQFDQATRKWTVDRWGLFDFVVIAHSGKCAAKLTENAQVSEINRLLQTRFSSQVNPRDNRMTLCSLYVLMVAFEKPLKLEYEGAHVTNEHISWIANNTKKMKSGQGERHQRAQIDLECWTIISTKKVGEDNKVPQSHFPPRVEERITSLLLESFAEATGLKGKLPPVCFQKLQLWGAAVPLNTLNVGADFVFDARSQIGVCGDWLVSPCVQGAALSGLTLADHIADVIAGSKSSSVLRPAFKQNSSSSPLGDFP